MNKCTKVLCLILMVVNLAGCCRTPQKCYPASPGNRYSLMGFIMGGGLTGHVIREAERLQREKKYGNKKVTEREMHKIYYHEIK